MNRHSQAPSTSTAARMGTTRARRTAFGMVCLGVLGLVALLGSGASSAGAESACPNEAIRQSQHAGLLPDCRAWEKVSPADKNNGDIVADILTTIAAKDGNGVAFNGRTGFGDTEGSGIVGHTNYLARRGPSGWSTHSVTPASRPDAQQTAFAATRVQLFSDDLSTAMVWGYDLPGATDDAPDMNNIYSEDTATRGVRTVTVPLAGHLPSPFESLFNVQNMWGLSADARHVAFVSRAQFLPEIPGEYPNSAQNVYQWDDGALHLAGILPNGKVPPGGSEIAPMNYRRDMSADGSRLLFVASTGGSPQLYQRIDGDRTVLISESENESFTEEPQAVYLEAATPDGKNVFFVTDSKLLDEDPNNGPDVYRWTDGPDPEHEQNLTLITKSGDALHDSIDGGAVAGASDDGQIVYYHTITDHLEVWDHGVTRLISPDVSRRAGSPTEQLTATVSQPGFGRVAPDGRYLAFLTKATLGNDNVHALTGQVSNGHFEMYVYGLEDEQLTCASCPSTPAKADVLIAPEDARVTSSPAIFANTAIRPRFLADNGKVFFSTPEALVPQDINGTFDAYEYDPATGDVGLLSSGRGSQPSAFLDASASGNDVFIATRQRLVGWDTDELADLYDVRTGGGFAEPETRSAPCSGEACQGSSAASPGDPSIVSAAAGAGNLRQGRHPRCGKHKRKVHRSGKVRCVKRHQGHGRANRRGVK